ncbi:MULTISPECIES: ATP:cob(I)alamin adenosyltransferase [unclassified Archaeoglobus]|jgi:cob(I)alamin adenosyltransferase|uniref:ATP:cob(I)alamin adenosyltransferase n=1 Tax=unclassified Archaeoglobus TaxID=2643606 RepID=UPI0025B86373|nr:MULTISPECIES: ATP:cob(I)alamin adenosyltransferase [unclassified Archaeoglobus]
MQRKDSSVTVTANGKVVSKDSNIAWYVGTLDEANAFIGLAKVFARDEEVKRTLGEVQRKMFVVGVEYAKSSLAESDYEWLMGKVKEFEDAVRKPNSFVILEKDEPTAFLSVARAVVRRAERIAVRLYREGVVGMNVVEWLNKLNYLLYLMTLKEGRDFEKI